MKVSTTQYAQKLFELTTGKSEQEVLTVVVDFIKQLSKDGQLKNVEKIMQKFADISNVKKNTIESPVIDVKDMKQKASDKVEKFSMIKAEACVEKIDAKKNAELIAKSIQ